MLQKMLDNVQSNTPLIYNITNYVTVNDCANILLACGASPIMSDEIKEVDDLIEICSGVNINIGTLNHRTLESMIAAGIAANKAGQPIILDPVGVGASKFRTDSVNRLLDTISFSVIRGNISEIKNLALGAITTRGVDANIADNVCADNLDSVIKLIQDFSKNIGAIIVVTGALDIIANKDKVYIATNGHAMMAKITGSGCMLSALLAAYVAANPSAPLEASLSAVCAMGICGERAWQIMQANNAGNSSYRNFLIDCMYSLNGIDLQKYAKYEVR